MSQQSKSSKSPSKATGSSIKKNHMTCRRQHTLKFQSVQKSEVACNDCRHKISKNGNVYGCAACLFYLCTICYRKKACNKGHPLTVHRVNKDFSKCVECAFQVQKDTRMYSCRTCKYNLCVGCYNMETCPGDHGLHLQTNKSKKTLCCNYCKRIFELNHSLFMCKECQYCLCSDCYRPMTVLKQNSKKDGESTSKSAKDENDVKTSGVVEDNKNKTNGLQELDDSLASLEETPHELIRIPSIFTECVVCMEHEKNQLFQPCGHYICCESCAVQLMSPDTNPGGGLCPVCNKKIEQCFRVINC